MKTNDGGSLYSVDQDLCGNAEDLPRKQDLQDPLFLQEETIIFLFTRLLIDCVIISCIASTLGTPPSGHFFF